VSRAYMLAHWASRATRNKCAGYLNKRRRDSPSLPVPSSRRQCFVLHSFGFLVVFASWPDRSARDHPAIKMPGGVPEYWHHDNQSEEKWDRPKNKTDRDD
jgi:hypothetical protein